MSKEQLNFSWFVFVLLFLLRSLRRKKLWFSVLYESVLLHVHLEVIKCNKSFNASLREVKLLIHYSYELEVRCSLKGCVFK